MSNIDKTADLTPKSGMDLRSTAKTNSTPYVQNVIPRNGDFWTRPGFGMVYQFDTSMAAGRVSSSDEYGIGPCIGATSIRTAWNTDQILSIHPLYAFTGNMYGRVLYPTANQSPLYGRRATYLAGVIAVVHDLYTNRKTEFVLYEQDARRDYLPDVYPNYSTRYNDDHSTWVIPAHEPQWAIFASMNTGAAFGTQAFNVVVCIDGLGLWTYRPIDNPIYWSRQNDSLDRAILGPFVGEQGAFSELNLTEGLLSSADGAVYLNTSDIGKITSQCTWNEDRIIYAADNTLWFSDPHMPQAVLADSRYVIPTSDPITCVAPLRSSVFIATSGGKCWAYQPALGSAGTAAVGSLTSISLTNGCVNNRAWCVGNEGVFFADPNGVFLWTGGVQLLWLSRPIDRLWSDPQSLELPLTDFYQNSGTTKLTSVQLPARLDMREQMQNARLCWDDARKALYCVCDDVTLVWTTDFGWSVWLFQTHAGSGSDVQGLANISQPTLVPVRNDLYMVGGPDVTTYKDYSYEVPPQVKDRSCYLLKLGRGGAIDRSSCMDAAIEDVWTCTLSGYFVAGSVIKITVGAIDYSYTMVADEDFVTTYQNFVASIQAAGDPEYNFIAQPDRILAVSKTAGVSASPVVTTVVSGAGTFTTVQIQVATPADLRDADLEDWRTAVNGWVKHGTTDKTCAYYLGPPSIAAPGFKSPLAFFAQSEQTYWWPLAIANVSTPPDLLSLRFNFDNTRWRPICQSATVGDPNYGEMDPVLPSERLASVSGYKLGTHDASHQICVYNAGLGTADPLGDQIRINFSGIGGPWTTAPFINAGVVGPDVLVYLGFQYIGLDSDFDLHAHPPVVPTVGGQEANLYSWSYGRHPVEYNELADKQQPVDWVVKTREVEVNGYQFTVRGVFLTALHFGNGTDDVVPGWLYGPLNTATSTDWRDYSGQALDFASTPPGNSAQNDILAFPRMVPTNVGENPVLKVFNNVATWGDTADKAAGNLLVDDPAVDTLATTDGSKGMRASVMVHGTLNAPGEVVKLGRIEAAIKQVGLRQRWGK